MRLIVFFDLPTTTSKDIREYTSFRKFLLKEGFIMIQESVYSKLVLNGSSSQVMKRLISNNLPSDGIVELLEITERQFSKIEYLVGRKQSKVLDSIERVVKL